MGETPSAKNRPIVIAVKLYARVLVERLFKVGAIIGSMTRIILIEKKHKTKRTKKIAAAIRVSIIFNLAIKQIIIPPMEESGETLTVPKFLCCITSSSLHIRRGMFSDTPLVFSANQGMDPNTLIKTKKKAKNKTNFLLQLKVGSFSDLTSLADLDRVRSSYFQSLPLSYHLKDKSLRKKCQTPWLARGEPTKDKNEEIRQPIRNLKPKGKQQQKAKAMIDKPFPSNERVVLVDSHIAGKTSVIPIGLLAIAGNHEATINATKTSR
ncbi:6750_t:CDS:2 [Entrophospora sp. SA101]|nr:7402_t:CDS:2 [Entrophospora sp. SA101]CAJ0824687.1 6750_t:CDS:2 [Entrophospora sp. SA101]